MKIEKPAVRSPILERRSPRVARARTSAFIASYDLGSCAHDPSAVQGQPEHARWQAEQSANAPGGTWHATSHYESAKWDNNVITWSFANSPGSTSSPFSGYIGTQYQSLVEKAFQAWAEASGLTLEEVLDSQQSDIRIGWGDFDTSDSGVVGFTSSKGLRRAISEWSNHST